MIFRLLALAARHGRSILILGLVAGVALPGLALAMRPWIGPVIASLLFLSALRIGPRQAVGALGDVGSSVGITVLLQIFMPIVAIAIAAIFGVGGTAAATFFVLMLAAAPISGSPNLAVMSGTDPAPVLRQLVVGTALLPLTVLPVFWLAPAFGNPSDVFGAAGGLMLLILAACGSAFLLRGFVWRDLSLPAVAAVDGMSAIVMAVVVVGLMSAVGPALRVDPLWVLIVLAVVCAVNFAIQISATMLAGKFWRADRAVAQGILAGNRNIALFLSVLPRETVDPLLLFIGCFQVPMYLTPAVLGRFYSGWAQSRSQSVTSET